MRRKDCDISITSARPIGLAAAVWTIVLASVSGNVAAQSIRLWPQAVVTNDHIRIADLCALDADVPQRVGELLVSAAPPPGGSALISMTELRRALNAGGVNLAQLRLKGAIECAVTRPGDQVKTAPASGGRDPQSERGPARRAGDPPKLEHARPVERKRTLRDAVREAVERPLARYHVQTEVTFARSSQPALDLAEPEYQFVVRRRSSDPLGVQDIEVDILRDAQKVQSVGLTVNVSATRPTIVARRAINQGAQIEAADIEQTALAVTRLEVAPAHDAGAFVGQRAKRYLATGTVLSEADVERVPLVNRGQVVDVYARVGGVTVVTSAKATQTAGMGDTVQLRSGNRRDESIAAVVTGPRRVEIRDRAGGVLAAKDSAPPTTKGRSNP